MTMTTANKGKTVQIHYTGKLDDGTVFDSSEGKEPLRFELGSGMVIPGFEQAVMGMKLDEEKDVKIACADAYGEHRPELVQEVPREALGEIEPKVGMMLAMQMQGQEQTFPGKVTKVSDDKVTIDVNSPLAGQDLHFHLKLVAIDDAAATTQ